MRSYTVFAPHTIKVATFQHLKARRSLAEIWALATAREHFECRCQTLNLGQIWIP